jgi:hypothetical protein
MPPRDARSEGGPRPATQEGGSSWRRRRRAGADVDHVARCGASAHCPIRLPPPQPSLPCARSCASQAGAPLRVDAPPSWEGRCFGRGGTDSRWGRQEHTCMNTCRNNNHDAKRRIKNTFAARPRRRALCNVARGSTASRARCRSPSRLCEPARRDATGRWCGAGRRPPLPLVRGACPPNRRKGGPAPWGGPPTGGPPLCSARGACARARAPQPPPLKRPGAKRRAQGGRDKEGGTLQSQALCFGTRIDDGRRRRRADADANTNKKV